MTNKYGLVAKLVWDGGDSLRIPEELGTPAPNQMKGTVGERLTELSGRTCYDSLGRGRSSEDYHQHILDVGHLSVGEHFTITVESSMMVNPWLLINRPGIWVRPGKATTRLTFNPRVILDWDLWSKELEVDDFLMNEGSLGSLLSYHMESMCPMLVKEKNRSSHTSGNLKKWTKMVEPEHPEEKWISFFMGSSRGWSHEQVRHRFRTGVSQRSTRFVDEGESPWVDHPLIQEFWAATDPVPDDPDNRLRAATKALTDDTKRVAREAYTKVSETLQKWLLSRGVDKQTARKQSRGAARGYLGNALATEMIFSASVGQWKRMLRLRCSDPADAEIRAVFVDVLRELKGSRYGRDFEGFELVPSSDRFGQCAVERKI